MARNCVTAVWDRFARFVTADLPQEEDGAAGGKLLRECARLAPLSSGLLVLATVASSVASLLLPATVASAIDAAGRGVGVGGVLLATVIVLAILTAADAALELADAYYRAAVTARLRKRLVDHLLALGRGGRQRFPAGNALSRLTVDTASPAGFLPLLVTSLVSLVTLVGCVVALALISWWLAVTFVLGVPLALLVVRLFLSDAGEPFLRYQQVQSDIAMRLLDALRGARTIRASGTSGDEIRRILTPLPKLTTAGRQMWATQGKVSWQLLLLVSLLQIAVVCVGGIELAAGWISVGELVASAGYVLLAVNTFEVVDSVVDLLSAYVGATRVATVLATPALPQGDEDAAPALGPGRVELTGISMCRGDRVVLDNLDLTIAGGSSLALVGRSGSGKSVLASLIGGLTEPRSGTIHLDGVAVADLTPQTLRKLVAYAFERPQLLGETIHDVIAYPCVLPRVDVRRAAEAVQADQFIRRLPRGYDTPLRDVRLSGGEIQRLGLARAICGDARIVVLDDATSSLDTATEREVARALNLLLENRTCLVVAHRAATAARADVVAWLENGRVKALAPHSVLRAEASYRAVFAVGDEEAEWETIDGEQSGNGEVARK